MIENGLLDEVKGLLDQGYSAHCAAFSAIGYRELIRVIEKEIDLAEAVLLMKRYTRQFVRRQANWFKPTDPAIHWFDLTQTGVPEIKEFIQSYF